MHERSRRKRANERRCVELCCKSHELRRNRIGAVPPSVAHPHAALGACCIGARCLVASATHRLPEAHRCVVRCAARVRCAIGRRAGLCGWPSGGAMRSCAEIWRWWRALHGQGHRAVRRRGDIRHRIRGACEAGRMRYGGGCRQTGCAADCGGRGCVGCAQGGGVVRMDDGAVTFKGGTISDTKAVRARQLRSHVACRMLQRLLLSVACWRTTMRAT
jgi:hypothetical protein